MDFVSGGAVRLLLCFGVVAVKWTTWEWRARLTRTARIGDGGRPILAGMNEPRLLTCFMAIILFTSACSTGRPTASSEYQQAAAQLAAAFATTWNAKDGPAYGAAYWPDAELVDPSGGIFDGRDAIIKTHEDLWAATGNTTASTTVRRVRPVSPTLMVVDITTVVTGFPAAPPGGTADANGAVHSNLKHLAEKRGNDWKILVSQNTFIQPAK